MDDARRKAEWQRRLRRQDGVFDLDQARAAGLGPETVRRRIAAGEWTRVAHRVFQVADHTRTPRSRAFAAILSLGGEATLVGRSAAWWWRMEETAPAVIEVAVPPGCRPRARAGVRVLRRAVAAEDRRTVDGLAVTARPLTLLTACARLGLTDGARMIDRALQQRHVRLDRLREVHARTAGRWGTPASRELLILAAGGARSEAERVAHGELRAAGILGWSANLEVRLPGFGLVVLDLAFPVQRVVVEIDGWAYHRDLRAFLRDGPRQTTLAREGWMTVRTHWYELRETPRTFVTNLDAVLARRS